MSQAQDRNISIHDLTKVGFVAVCFNDDDLSKLPPRIQNEVRQSKIDQLEAIERPLNQIEFGDRHPFGRKQHDELTKLRAERDAATQGKPAAPQPQYEPVPAQNANSNSSVTSGGVSFVGNGKPS